jgi:Protein of unknown function (DUF3485)
MKSSDEFKRSWSGAQWQVISAYAGTGEQWLVALQYRVGRRVLVSAFQAKLTQGLSGLLGDTGAGVVAVATPCIPDCQTAEFLLESFVQEVAGQKELIH